MTSLSLSVIEVYKNEAGGRGASAGKEAGWLPSVGLWLCSVPWHQVKVSEGSGRKATQKMFRAQLALPSGGWAWGQSSAIEYCPTHWGFPTGLLRPSLWDLTVNSARTLTRLGPEPWRGGEEPRRAAGPSCRHTARPLQSKEGAEKVSQGAQLQQEALCPHQDEG